MDTFSSHLPRKSKPLLGTLIQKYLTTIYSERYLNLQAGLKVGAFSATYVISSYVMYEVIDPYGSIPRFNKLLAMIGSFRVGKRFLPLS